MSLPKRRRGDAELRSATEAHYADPAYYAKNYGRRLEDVRYYVKRALAVRGPVLEYGCGNGRITLPMARAGAEVFGIDLSPPMLADLAVRLETEPGEVRARVKLKRGDMRTVKVAKKFALVICPFNAFLHLYERRDVEKFFARVKEHLAPGASFVFDVSRPEPEELARDPERKFHTPRFNYPGVGLVKYGERFDYEPMRQVLFVSMEFAPVSGEKPFMTPLAHRQFYPLELEALLHYNGLRIAKLEGEFDGKPATRESRTLVYTVKPRRAAAAKR